MIRPDLFNYCPITNFQPIGLVINPVIVNPAIINPVITLKMSSVTFY